MRPPKAYAVDAVETFGLVALPAALVGALTLFAGGDASLGALVGGMFGAILAAVRREYRAVVTEDGITRERRAVHTDDRNPWVRAANGEYDSRYDRAIAAAAALLSAGAFGYAAFVADNPDPRLLLAALGGFIVAALIYGAPGSGAAE